MRTRTNRRIQPEWRRWGSCAVCSSHELLTKILYFFTRGPCLPHAEVGAGQAETLGGRGLAAGVLHAQPPVVLAHDDERLTAPVARGPYVAEVLELGGRHHAAVAAGTYLVETLGGLGGVQPYLV